VIYKPNRGRVKPEKLKRLIQILISIMKSSLNIHESARDVDEALLILASVENNDETCHESVVKKVVSEISDHAGNLKVHRIILHPFAHLFADLSKPETALEILKLSEEGLVQRARGTESVE